MIDTVRKKINQIIIYMCFILLILALTVCIKCAHDASTRHGKSTNESGGDKFDEARAKMVEEDIKARGVTDPEVLRAMGTVKRHLFVDENLQDQAYNDHPLPIDEGQTISQPYIVALMTEALKIKPGEKVLEIGTGSGYQAAVLAELTGEVYSIECNMVGFGAPGQQWSQPRPNSSSEERADRRLQGRPNNPYQ